MVSQTGSITYPTVDSGGNWSAHRLPPSQAISYYSGGYLGTLKIPAIGLSVRVYEGTDSGTLAKGAGHFPGTSIWMGMFVLQATTGVYGMTLETCTP